MAARGSLGEEDGNVFEDDRGLLQGTLPMLILRALSAGTLHGYGVARWIEAATSDALSVEEGSLYPALHRIAAKGWIESEWGLSENNRRAKFYSLTAKGRKELARQRDSWARLVDIVDRALDAGSAS